jgi:hypothetical protein
MDNKVLDKLLDLAASGQKDLVKELLPFVTGATGSQAQTVQALPFKVGENYFIRTVTYHLTGKVKDIVGKFLVLEKCSWIADSGRFSDAMEKGIDKQENAEVEPFSHDVFVNSDSITDAMVYPYTLPDEQK